MITIANEAIIANNKAGEGTHSFFSNEGVTAVIDRYCLIYKELLHLIMHGTVLEDGNYQYVPLYNSMNEDLIRLNELYVKIIRTLPLEFVLVEFNLDVKMIQEIREIP